MFSDPYPAFPYSGCTEAPDTGETHFIDSSAALEEVQYSDATADLSEVKYSADPAALSEVKYSDDPGSLSEVKSYAALS